MQLPQSPQLVCDGHNSGAPKYVHVPRIGGHLNLSWQKGLCRLKNLEMGQLSWMICGPDLMTRVLVGGKWEGQRERRRRDGGGRV